MITNLVNPAPTILFGTASCTMSFSTDATPAVQTTATSSANGTSVTVASGTGLVLGDFFSIEGGGTGGTVPWVNTINLFNSTTSIKPIYPSVLSAVTGAALYRYERFEGRYKASKVTLTNLTTGDVYVWDFTLKDDQAKYTPSGGAQTTLLNRGILNKSNSICIHPNLLPPSNSFTLKCDYDYYS